MKNQEILDFIFSHLPEFTDSHFHQDSDFKEDLGMDSLDVMDLVVECDSHFDIDIVTKCRTPQELTTEILKQLNGNNI